MGYTDDILKSIASEKKPGDVEQYGVKGMKWGVRKPPSKSDLDRQAKDSPFRIEDSDLLKTANSSETRRYIASRGVMVASEKIRGVNKKYSEKDLEDDRKYAAYRQEINSLIRSGMNIVAASAFGTNKSETHRLGVRETPDGVNWEVYVEETG